MAFSTIAEMFLSVVNTYSGGTRPVYMRKLGAQYQGISYGELREMVENFAFGLLELGVQPGERLGIVSENRLEWIVADFAAVCFGIIDVPVFPTLTGKQLEFIYNDCDAVAIVVSNQFQLSKVLKIEEELKSLRHIIVMSSEVQSDHPLVIHFSRVSELGAKRHSPAEKKAAFEERSRAVQPDDPLTLIYTSGTTGNPKGVLLTHRNMSSNIEGALEKIDLKDSDLLLSYLPLCHAYERMAGYYSAFSTGATTAFAESIETVAENLREVKPTVATSVPRLFEKIRKRVYANIEKEAVLKQRIFHWAVRTGKAYIDAKKKKNIPLTLHASYALADRLVFSTIRERTGGRLRMFVSGGAALPADIGEFFQMIGIPVIEGYGLTEASPVLAANSIDDIEFGSVGTPLFNIEMKIAEDGEILARGPNIMKGYWNDEKSTRESIDEEGWLHTGDIGHFNQRGHLVITDRKKHIFVSVGGKNISPQPVEQLLALSPYIEQCVLIGDKREYCTALIVPDWDAVRSYAKQAGFQPEGDMTKQPEVLKLIESELSGLQKDIAKYERARKFRLLPRAFTVEDGEMTPTLKIKRNVVEKKYSELIDEMYSVMNER